MPPPTEPWTRGARIALFVVAVIATGALVALHHPWYEPSGSTAWALAAARGLATGEPLFERGQASVPGFAHLLASLAGGEHLDFGRIHLATALAGSAAVVLLFLYQRPRLGWPTAALGALAVAASPGFVRSCNRASDVVPGTALLLACLLVERWSTARPTSARSFVSGLAIGLNAWVRPLHLLLLPAVLLARTLGRAGAPTTVRGWVRTIGREHGPIALGTLVTLLPQLFTVCTIGRIPWAPPEGAPLGLAQLTALLGNGLHEGEPVTRGALLVGLAIAVGSIDALVRRRGAGEFAALAIALVALTAALGLPAIGLPAAALLPVLVLGLPAILGTLRDGAGRVIGQYAGTVVACAVAVLWIVARFDPHDGHAGLRAQHQDLVEFATQVDAQLPDGARVASSLGLHLALFLDRPVIAIDPGLDTQDDDAIEAWIDRERVEVFALYPRVPTDLELVPYVLRRYGEWDPDRVVTIPPGFLARVRP